MSTSFSPRHDLDLCLHRSSQIAVGRCFSKDTSESLLECLLYFAEWRGMDLLYYSPSDPASRGRIVSFLRSHASCRDTHCGWLRAGASEAGVFQFNARVIKLVIGPCVRILYQLHAHALVAVRDSMAFAAPLERIEASCCTSMNLAPRVLIAQSRISGLS